MLPLPPPPPPPLAAERREPDKEGELSPPSLLSLLVNETSFLSPLEVLGDGEELILVLRAVFFGDADEEELIEAPSSDAEEAFRKLLLLLLLFGTVVGFEALSSLFTSSSTMPSNKLWLGFVGDDAW